MRTIIDAWSQHPSARHLNDPIFDSLRRWTKGLGGPALAAGAEWPLQVTLDAMNAGGVTRSLLSAWVGPRFCVER